MTTAKLLLGCAFLGVTAVTWVTASFLAQYLVSGPQPGLHPFLLCWICTSLFSLYLPIIACKQRLQRSRSASGSSGSGALLGRRSSSSSSGEEDGEAGPPRTHGDAAGPAVLFPHLSRTGAALKVLPVAVIFLTAQFLFTLSLANTSVTSNTILSSSASMWTLLASALVLRERVTPIKLFSVVAVMAGTAMVTLADSSEAAAAAGSDRSLFGDALCVASAMCYSCYTVILQRELREDDADTPALFFGWVGVLVAVGGLPVVLLLHCLGSYDLTALDLTALGLALLNGLMDYVVADYTWARAVLLLSPTVATLGTSIQVPLATAADVVLGQPHWLDSWRAVGLTAGGTVLILGGVGGINLDPHRHSSSSSSSSGAVTAVSRGSDRDPERADSSRAPLLEA